MRVKGWTYKPLIWAMSAELMADDESGFHARENGMSLGCLVIEAVGVLEYGV
jgi:hypothetical protein